MDHANAAREMSVEKYLLGELTGPARDSFEEHLFDCQLCAADIDNGLRFANAARAELAAEARERSAAPEKRGWFDWVLRPQWLAPALAACALLLGYQSVFRIPALQQELQMAQSPKFVEDSLSMSSGPVRGEVKHVPVEKNGVFVVSVDLPPQAGYTAFEFVLYSPSGARVWTGTRPVSQARDTEQIIIPVAATQSGVNMLTVQGLRAPGGGTLDAPVSHKFVLEPAR